jgi:hypothetical protein
MMLKDERARQGQNESRWQISAAKLWLISDHNHKNVLHAKKAA